VHNRYQIRGGEEEVRDAERSLLEKMGHTVDIYEDTNDRVVSLGAMQVAVNTVWSSTAYQALQRQIDQHRYDVMHVHNLFPLISPAAYYAAKEKQIPVVQTLHNYRLLCPNALFFRNGQVCEDCLGKPIPWPGVQHGCYRENRAASGVVATMLTAHHLLGTWQQKVDLYIALTEFARKKFVEGGIPAEKVSVKPHFVDPDPGIGGGAGRFALYVGRLSVEKGLDILLAAWRQLQGKVPLKIVGTGTLSDTVIAASQEIPAVEYLGRLPMQDVYDLMGEASMVIVPSKWYETFGRVVIEAFAKGTPAIVSNIGAIAELVDPGRTGLHFQTGNAGDLATQVKWFMSNPTLEKTMRQEARREFEGKYTAATNYQQLIKIYNQACVRCNSFKSSEVHG
jgi:glycosyltransferase involved in cell wall biosynthesis